MSSQAAAVDLGVSAAWCVMPRSMLAVTGSDAEAFLQGQLTQDVAALAPQQSAWSLVLAPQGRIDAFVRVSRLGPEHFVLDTDGLLGPLLERLDRFMLRTKATLEPVRWGCMSIRGYQDHLVAVKGHEVRGVCPKGGVDYLGVDIEVSEELPQMDEHTFDAHRITVGWPRMGVDIDQRTIPAEAEIVAHTVSFTKGCFTGQELVARMNSRGNTAPRYLRVLSLHQTAAVAHKDVICDEHENEIGMITSVAVDGVGQRKVALGYIKRSVAMPAMVMVAGNEAVASPVPR
ncbi:MAG: hypothetical protein OXE93_09225 [bacterium]|nr:hypothetical protein [bacterium]